jgi:hypothetical protein
MGSAAVTEVQNVNRLTRAKLTGFSTFGLMMAHRKDDDRYAR